MWEEWTSMEEEDETIFPMFQFFPHNSRRTEPICVLIPLFHIYLCCIIISKDDLFYEQICGRIVKFSVVERHVGFSPAVYSCLL